MENLNKHIEHTLLKQDAKENDLIKLFEEAKEHEFLGVCINPCYVRLAKENLKNTNVKIVTVIGFPLGANTTETKIFETINAVRDGADEIVLPFLPPASFPVFLPVFLYLSLLRQFLFLRLPRPYRHVFSFAKAPPTLWSG